MKIRSLFSDDCSLSRMIIWGIAALFAKFLVVCRFLFAFSIEQAQRERISCFLPSLSIIQSTHTAQKNSGKIHKLRMQKSSVNLSIEGLRDVVISMISPGRRSADHCIKGTIYIFNSPHEKERIFSAEPLPRC